MIDYSELLKEFNKYSYTEYVGDHKFKVFIDRNSFLRTYEFTLTVCENLKDLIGIKCERYSDIVYVTTNPFLILAAVCGRI